MQKSIFGIRKRFMLETFIQLSLNFILHLGRGMYLQSPLYKAFNAGKCSLPHPHTLHILHEQSLAFY